MKKQILAIILSSIGMIGMSQTPQIISNINKAGLGSNPSGMTAFKDKLYFSANANDFRGIELYQLDNSQSSGNKITQVDDIRSGQNGSSPRYLHVFNDTLFFSATGQNGTEIFKYDGINDPEVAISGVTNSSPFIEYKEKLYYGTGGVLNAYTKTGSLETQVINSVGSVLVSDLTIYDDTLYFIASDGSNDGKGAIWKYDGENAPSEVPNTFGTTSNRSDYASNLIAFSNKLYFSYQASNTIGTELYSYDGDTVLLEADINVGVNGSYPSQLTAFNNKLYLSAANTSTYGELFEYDGTNAPTLVADIYAGSDPSYPIQLKAFDGKLYFNANDGINGTQLWVFDGTTTSFLTGLNEDGSSDPSSLVVFDDELYFRANNGENGAELMKYSGSGSPVLVEDLIDTDGDSDPFDMVEFNDLMFFSATNGINGHEIWVYDGIESKRYADMISGTIPSNAGNFVVYKDSLFFTGNGVLYRTDGLSEPTLVPNVAAVSIEELTVVNEFLYFGGYESASGQELWVYDGTSASLVADMTPGNPNSTPRNLMNVNGVLTFTNTFTEKIWTYNGSTPPVELIQSSFARYEEPRNFTVFKNNLYYSAQTDLTLFFNGMTATQSHRQIFRTNGVNSPTVVSSLEYTVGTYDMGVYNNKLVFQAEELEFPAFIPYFFTYDGVNTVERLDLNGLSQVGQYTEVNDTLYFRGGNGAASLWRYVTGGTPEFVSTIPGDVTNRLENLVSFNGNLIFTADDGISGRELWGLRSKNPLGLNFFETQNEVSSILNIYPNPTDGIIQTEEGVIALFDAVGNLAFTTYSEGIIDVSSLEAGLYIVHQNNKKTKLIIE